MNGNDVDAALLRRARRILAVQTTTSIVLSVLVVGVLAVFVVVRAERSALERSLRQTAATEEDVVDPPDGSWIFEQDTAGRITGTKDPPAGLPDRAALDRVRAGGGSEMRQTTVRDVDYVVLTRRRGTETIQVVGSLATLESERNRLLAALAMATAAGLVVALLFAGLLARRATAPLGDALDRQRQFVADASHELRTPLTQLHTRAQLLERDLRAGATSAEMAPDVEQLVAGTRQLGEVVEDLLISSQVPQGAHEHDDVDLGAIAATVVAGLSTRARDQEVELALLPGAEGASVVWGREPALRRVLTALIDNALSHTPAGGHVTVELGTEEAGRWVTAVVRDDGSGFDPADAERIFRRFARGHGDTRRFGLGLALAREVVAGHGGTIDARGRLGEGATFTIRMPAGSARH